MGTGDPLVFQLSTRAFLTRIGDRLGKRATFDDIPDIFLFRLKDLGFDHIYVLGIWTTGEAGVSMSASKMGPLGFGNSDVCSSPFAITDYSVNSEYGGEESFCRFRKRAAALCVKLLVDFVPNHMAIDHPWTSHHPELFVHGNEDLIRSQPRNYFRLGSHILAHGRDPYYDGWADTVQLNYHKEATQDEMVNVLEKISEIADGVRCDMAMLVLEDVFLQTWGEVVSSTTKQQQQQQQQGRSSGCFWRRALRRVRRKQPSFLFVAEVYWDREYDLQQCGFDYTYDKRLLDRLRGRDVAGVNAHLHAHPCFQSKSVRFLENHDEERAAAAASFATAPQHAAAAVVALTVPGMHLLHQGQLCGRTRHLSMHLRRWLPEPGGGEAAAAAAAVRALYVKLLRMIDRPAFRRGECVRASTGCSQDGNQSHHSFVAHFRTLGIGSEPSSIVLPPPSDTAVSAAAAAQEGPSRELLLVVVNYSDRESNGHVMFPPQLRNHLRAMGGGGEWAGVGGRWGRVCAAAGLDGGGALCSLCGAARGAGAVGVSAGVGSACV